MIHKFYTVTHFHFHITDLVTVTSTFPTIGTWLPPAYRSHLIPFPFCLFLHYSSTTISDSRCILFVAHFDRRFHLISSAVTTVSCSYRYRPTFYRSVLRFRAVFISCLRFAVPFRSLHAILPPVFVLHLFLWSLIDFVYRFIELLPLCILYHRWNTLPIPLFIPQYHSHGLISCTHDTPPLCTFTFYSTAAQPFWLRLPHRYCTVLPTLEFLFYRSVYHRHSASCWLPISCSCSFLFPVRCILRFWTFLLLPPFPATGEYHFIHSIFARHVGISIRLLPFDILYNVSVYSPTFLFYVYKWSSMVISRPTIFFISTTDFCSPGPYSTWEIRLPHLQIPGVFPTTELAVKSYLIHVVPTICYHHFYHFRYLIPFSHTIYITGTDCSTAHLHTYDGWYHHLISISILLWFLSSDFHFWFHSTWYIPTAIGADYHYKPTTYYSTSIPLLLSLRYTVHLYRTHRSSTAVLFVTPVPTGAILRSTTFLYHLSDYRPSIRFVSFLCLFYIYHHHYRFSISYLPFPTVRYVHYLFVVLLRSFRYHHSTITIVVPHSTFLSFLRYVDITSTPDSVAISCSTVILHLFHHYLPVSASITIHHHHHNFVFYWSLIRLFVRSIRLMTAISPTLSWSIHSFTPISCSDIPTIHSCSSSFFLFCCSFLVILLSHSTYHVLFRPFCCILLLGLHSIHRYLIQFTDSQCGGMFYLVVLWVLCTTFPFRHLLPAFILQLPCSYCSRSYLSAFTIQFSWSPVPSTNSVLLLPSLPWTPFYIPTCTDTSIPNFCVTRWNTQLPLPGYSTIARFYLFSCSTVVTTISTTVGFLEFLPAPLIPFYTTYRCCWRLHYRYTLPLHLPYNSMHCFSADWRIFDMATFYTYTF